jgi:hypothetical protein
MICENCKKEFNGRPNQKYCSKKCRTQYWGRVSYINNKDKRLEYQNRLENKERAQKLEKQPHRLKQRREHQKQRRKTDPIFKLRLIIRERLKHENISLNKKILDDVLGYSIQELWNQLSNNIESAKDKFLSGELQLDHIIPVMIFPVRDIRDINFRKCWNKRNLRLIPKEENLKRKWKTDIEYIRSNIPDLFPTLE